MVTRRVEQSGEVPARCEQRPTRAATGPSPGHVDGVGGLARAAGNRVVCQLLASGRASDVGAPTSAPRVAGLPGPLQAGIERLSGLSVADVRVHYDSQRPARLQALAYTQGSEIHVAPGQEQHLPHEAWHVVQQKQGRVRTTAQLGGVGLNDERRLEAEADEMGLSAARGPAAAANIRPATSPRSFGSVQRAFGGHDGPGTTGTPAIQRKLIVDKKVIRASSAHSGDRDAMAGAKDDYAFANENHLGQFLVRRSSASDASLRADYEAFIALADEKTTTPREFAKDPVAAVREWLDESRTLGGQGPEVRLLAGAGGKNNLGIFAVTGASGKYIVKVVLGTNASQLRQLDGLNSGFEALAESKDPEMPAFARLLEWGTHVHGVPIDAALGLFEAASGRTVADVHSDWAKHCVPSSDMSAMYRQIGKTMGALHFSGVNVRSGSNALKSTTRMHNDANPSNMFVDAINRVTLIDNESFNARASLSAFSYELGSTLQNFEAKTFMTAGAERKARGAPVEDDEKVSGPHLGRLTATEYRVWSELTMFYYFAEGYLSKCPDSFRPEVAVDLAAKRESYLKLYLESADGVMSRQAAEGLLPGFFRKLTDEK